MTITMTPRINGAHVPRDAIGTALINSDPGLSAAGPLTTAAGAAAYLPQYRDATQREGDKVLFCPTLTEDGRLTLYLTAAAPAEIGARAAGAVMHPAPPTATLVYTVAETIRRLPLNAEPAGGALWKLTADVARADLADLRKVMFDTVPSAQVSVTRTASMAAPLTRTFVTAAWKDPTLHAALLDSFSGIPMPDAETFLRLVRQAYPNYDSEFMLIDCTYTDETPVPPLEGFIEWRLNWKGATYQYYEDNYRPGRIHYLPDQFPLAVEPTGAPAVSLLKFETPDGNIESTVATFRFLGVPQVERARLEDAGRQIAVKTGKQPEFVSLQHAAGVSTRFTLVLPNASGTTGVEKCQPASIIDLEKGVRDEVVLSLPAFQALWAAIFSERQEQTLFVGWVDVMLSGDRYSARVEFLGRLKAGTMQEYFDRIIDSGADLSYATEVSVKVPRAIFSEARNPQVLAINVNFGPEAVASIDAPDSPNAAPMLTKTLKVRRAVADIVLGRAATGRFDYTLKVVTLEGERCARRSMRDTTLYITEKDLADCKDPCE